jgi:nitrate reductase gamma subunit
MDLLDFARGPGLWISLLVFCAGSAWRLAALWRRPHERDHSPPREGVPGAATLAARAIVRGMWPRRRFGQAATVVTANGYVMHVGLALVAFGYAPHIAFIRRLSGLHWPALPDAVMALAAAATIVSMLFALWLRLSDAVLRQISGADDHLSWALTLLPLLTGMAVAAEPSSALLAPGALHDRGALAVHLLSFELLLLWFPFGKLMHAFTFALSRGATGIRLGHRGVET